MKTKKISIYDIARKLGVSTSTVSRALQDNPAISVEMRDRIRKTAEEMGYKPNVFAVNLQRGSTRTIGVVVPMVSRNFFSVAIDGHRGSRFAAGIRRDDLPVPERSGTGSADTEQFSARQGGRRDRLVGIGRRGLYALPGIIPVTVCRWCFSTVTLPGWMRAPFCWTITKGPSIRSST